MHGENSIQREKEDAALQSRQGNNFKEVEARTMTYNCDISVCRGGDSGTCAVELNPSSCIAPLSKVSLPDRAVLVVTGATFSDGMQGLSGN